MSIKEHPPLHVPVLLDATLDQLDPKPGERYLDLTAGYGGHASRVLAATENYTDSVLVDRDKNAIRALEPLRQKGVTLIHNDFAAAAHSLVDSHEQFDIVLLDLGVSSPQLDQEARGFSFTHSGPLDMRMDPTAELTAEWLVNTAKRDKLIRIITEYGEEPRGFAQRIADAIIARRPIHTTGELADLVKQSYRGPWKKIHPATRTFQALRIAVNDELGQLEAVLPLLPTLLRKEGRVGIISFHSLEDRLVKHFFQEQDASGLEAELGVVTKKPLAGDIHDVHNPRSRSAKLRVAVKK